MIIKLIVFTAWYIICVLIHAYIDSERIRKNIKIHHGEEGVLFGFSCVFTLLLSPNTTEIIHSIVLMILCRYAFFDIFLNKFRGLNFYYEGTGTTTSIIDKIERKLNINVHVSRIIGLLLPFLYLGIVIFICKSS